LCWPDVDDIMMSFDRPKEATAMKRQVCFALIGCAALVQAACGSRALKSNSDVGAVRGDAIEMWVESEGRRLDVFEKDGRSYLLGEMGAPYEIVLVNRSDGRLEVVLSVDGRDAVSGREADFRANHGYVLDPDEVVRVQGFRTSLEGVARFEFSAAEESYGARMGTPENVGVIGLAVFDEASAPPEDAPPKIAKSQPGPIPAEDTAAASPSSKYQMDEVGGQAEIAQQGLGTKYGKNVDSTAVVVSFVRRDPENPSELLVLYYNDRAGLERLGIVLPPREELEPHRCAGPNPFPGVPCEDSGFAPPPP